MTAKSLVAATAAVLLLAGCGSSAPTAQSLAHKVPGCTPRFFSGGISPYASQEVTCDTAGATVWLATFKSSSLELDFLNSSSSVFGTECVQGSGWAATISEQGDSGNVEEHALIHAIGGRDVSTNACG